MSASGAAAGDELRRRRKQLVEDISTRGQRFGEALTDVVDGALIDLFAAAAPKRRAAIVALGSYARRELCPGSDVDVLLLYDAGWGRSAAREVAAISERLWYPLWDAGFVLGHGSRTIKETLALADADLDAMTSLLRVRCVAGDPALVEELASKAAELARRRARRLLSQLAAGADARRVRPGLIAEMLEPNVKSGGGGLRDLQAIEWTSVVCGVGTGAAPPDIAAMCTPADAAQLRDARTLLLDVRVALHRVTGGKSDVLALQDQDAVAQQLGYDDVDDFSRSLAAATRAAAWITRDVFGRISPGANPVTDSAPADRVAVKAGRVVVTDANPSALMVLEAAALASDRGLAFERETLDRLGAMSEPTWSVDERDAFVRVLRNGARAVPVFEALDHAGALVRLLPEWAHVRALPQRNAYHRYTVDRHLLAAVSECAALLDAGRDAIDPTRPDLEAIAARTCRRSELLLLGALLHDIGKGLDGDHATLGTDIAKTVMRRMGFDSEAIEIVSWLVRDHLVMAETATRRDLSDDATVERFSELMVGDGERLRLLYLLTIGDSRATGPAAWSRSKASLLRDLFVKSAAMLENDSAEVVDQERRNGLAELIGSAAADEHLTTLPAPYPLAFDAPTMAHHRELIASDRQVSCVVDDEHRVVVTVAVPDRAGLLATVAGALTVAGLAVVEAHVFSTTHGVALDVFRAADPFGRVADGAVERVEGVLHTALGGELDVAGGVEERRKHYERRSRDRERPPTVSFHLDDSDWATIIEVHAPDQIGLLFRLADALAGLDLDVRIAKVETLGHRVVDVFYVRDLHGRKITDPEHLTRIEHALLEVS